VAALLAQVLVVVGGGLLLGTALFAPLTRGQLGGLSLEFDGTAVLVWWVLLGVLALVSALFAVRRVLAIEPVAATSGGGLDR
jgi:putative ABC transport system permease protein